MALINRTAKVGSQTLSLEQARQWVLHAQGFSNRRARRPSASLLLTCLNQIGLLQIDSVNVLVRSHYLPLFSRLGAYDVDALDGLSRTEPRKLFEYWGHEASLIPAGFHKLFRWRMEEVRKGLAGWAGLARLAKERPDFIASVLEQVASQGPLIASQIAGGGKSSGQWWGWSEGKRALEYLFWTGQITAVRREKFERYYDLPERLLPKAVLDEATPSPDEAKRELCKMAIGAMGVATEQDVRDYFRMSVADTKSCLMELRESGEIIELAVENWRHPAYVLKSGHAGRNHSGTALLSPFDNLIWSRPRTERLFDFHYRLAFYTPREKRKSGYYVMPFLNDGRLCARVDLKSDRKASSLLVLGGHAEPGEQDADLAPALSDELARLARFLGLERVTIRGRTALLVALRRVTARQRG